MLGKLAPLTASLLIFMTSAMAQSASDTGVGENGRALASSPAFTETGGEPVTMKNVVRAETAKYLAEETIVTGPNKFRHERNGIDLDNQTVIGRIST